MSFIRPSSQLLHRPSTIWLLTMIAFCCIAAGCDQGSKPTASDRVAELPAEFQQDISHPVYLLSKDAFSLKISAANLAIRGWEAGSRAILESPHLQVVDAAGKDLLVLSAKRAIALHPWEAMSWLDFSLVSEEGTTFEGEELQWPFEDQSDQVAMLGPTLVITQTLMMEGDTIIGDPLLRGYEIYHVRSARDIDAPASPSNPDAGE